MNPVRSNTTVLLRRLAETAWAKVGRQTGSGRYAAEDRLRIYAEHLDNHARQIEAGGKAEAGGRLKLEQTRDRASQGTNCTPPRREDDDDRGPDPTPKPTRRPESFLPQTPPMMTPQPSVASCTRRMRLHLKINHHPTRRREPCSIRCEPSCAKAK